MRSWRGKAQVHALSSKADNLLTPLIEVDEDSISSASSNESSLYSSSTVSVKVKPTAFQIIKTTLVSTCLVGGVVASAASIVFAPVVAVIVMGAVVVANVPYAAYKEFRIVKLPALRRLNNMLREDANHLEMEVDTLTEEIDFLQPEAERATVVEAELRSIAAEQHGNVDKLVDLVKENEIILSQMRDNLRQRIVQDIIKIVMLSDKNNDGRFCKVETKMLVLKISLQLQEYGVEFDEAKFYRVMSVDPSVTRTLTIVKRLIPSLGDDEDDNSVSSGDDDDDLDNDAYDMFHMTEGSVSSSFGGMSLDAPRRLSLSVVPNKGTGKRTSLSVKSGSRRNKRGGSREGSTNLPATPVSRQDEPVYSDTPPAPTPDETTPRRRKRDFLKRALKRDTSI